jgi:aspartyl-tRNA(Asn)/glutamyl-tRNA(Gln) amidotransferase subunit A
MSEVWRPSAAELAHGYATKAISPVEATRAALAAIDALDPMVNAMVLVDADRALAEAAAAEQRWLSGSPLGPADGIPTTIKDIFLTRDWPTLRGSTLLDASGPWTEDAPAVARLREGGAVLLGKTSTPEFAWKGVTDSARFGATRNPWDPSRTTGGSSGGSAAAVALGMGAWSIGTDGGGSVRIPAAFTGTVALKPTYGLVPLYPASPFGTLAHAGPMTTSVVDAATLLDLLVGFDPRDWSALPTPTRSYRDDSAGDIAGVRVGYARQPFGGQNDPEVEQAVTQAVAVLAEAGALVEEVDLGLDDPVEAFHVLWFSGAAKVLQPFPAAARVRVDHNLLVAAAEGERATASDYLDAVAVRMALGQRLGLFHQRYDVLVTPTLPIPAFEVDRDVPAGSASPWWTSWTPYTYPFNLTQQPALSVPCGFTPSGLPIGLQIVGPRHADALLLRLGRSYQERTTWAGTTPPSLSASTTPGE